ncbi:S8 family serine peptidase [Microbacterium sp.]|uniref:S8 family serine peptidase n=1 Tax=Microbacterium sp. TaxID=51671 RepID=UPI002810FFDD|nr:S8 family serine peptidase [Microbacterium sp.]
MTARRMLRSTAVFAAVAASVILVGASPAAATQPASSAVPAASTPAPTPTPTAPIPDDRTDPARAAEYWLDSTGVRQAWQVTRGKGTTIAIIDTGIGKPPLAFDGAIAGGTDMSGSGSADGRTPVGAVDGNHGTWVASLAAARGKPDGTGMIGVAPEAKLLSISLGFGASAAVPFTEQVAKAMRWAVDHGADIINLSFTTNTLDWDESWDDAFLYAFEHDVVVVVAAGNRGSGTSIVGAPATIPGVLTVGGVDQNGVASEGASTQGITIGVSAPSENLLGISADGKLVTWDGTSGASPIVAGVAALVRSAHPDLDAANVINRIVKTAVPVAGAKKGTRDPLYGYGLLDANAAVTAPVPAVAENPMGDLAEWIRVYRRAESSPQPEPTATPIAVPPLPAADAPSEPGSPLLPSAETLRYGTLPLLAVTVPGILIGLGVTAAARRIRTERGRRA